MNYNELWHKLTALYDAGEAKAIVRMLLEERYGMSFADILGGALDAIDNEKQQQIMHDMDRLQQGEPIQHVLGYAWFYGRKFMVTPDVLVPRPETEELINLVKNNFSSLPPFPSEARLPVAFPLSSKILDIGTGSGCIAITLALEYPDWQVAACDISEKALEVARNNAETLGAKIDFIHADILQYSLSSLLSFPLTRLPVAFPPSSNKWDIIVSNPPYICEREKNDMHQNVLQHDPHLALFVPDDDPLLFYRAIAHYATNSLRKGGALFFEINPLYAADIAALLHQEGFRNIETHEDQYRKQRFVKCLF